MLRGGLVGKLRDVQRGACIAQDVAQFHQEGLLGVLVHQRNVVFAGVAAFQCHGASVDADRVGIEGDLLAGDVHQQALLGTAQAVDRLHAGVAAAGQHHPHQTAFQAGGLDFVNLVAGGSQGE